MKVTIIKPSAILLLLRLVAVLFALETVYGLAFFLYSIGHPSQAIDHPFIYFLWVSQVVKFLFMVYALAATGAEYLLNRYYLADHHIFWEKGLVNNEEKVYDLRNLRKVVVDQDWLGGRLDYGSLHLVLGGRSFSEELHLSGIAQPEHIKDMLDKFVS